MMSLPPNVIDFLFDAGHFPHILKKIFISLDGNSLASAEASSPRWRSFIRQAIWNDEQVLAELNKAWSKHMPKFSVKFHGTKLVSMACSARYIVGGEELTGNIAVYNRQEIVRERSSLQYMFGSQTTPLLVDHIRPMFLTRAHTKTVTAVELSGEILFTGSLDGSLRIWDVSRNLLIQTVIEGNKEINDIKVRAKHLYFTYGYSIMAYALLEEPDGVLRVNVKTMMIGHKGTVLCLAVNSKHLMASGSLDKTVMVWCLRKYKSLRILRGHQAKVRCVAMNNAYIASGGYDRTCRIWSLPNGICVRLLQQELFVRSVALEDDRLVTGDTGGYIFIWSFPNCVDPSKGTDTLCYRAHNAIDTDRPMTEQQRSVFGLHLESGVLIAVAGQNGRIGIQDFWDNVGPDVFNLESYII